MTEQMKRFLYVSNLATKLAQVENCKLVISRHSGNDIVTKENFSPM